MPQVTPVIEKNLPPSNRNVRNTREIGSQSFSISVTGLSISTDVNVYLDFNKVSTNNLQPTGGIRGDKLTTDAFGKLAFTLYYVDGVPGLGNLPEANFINYLNRSSQQLLVVVVDKSSIDSAILPESFRTISRSYAEGNIYRSYTLTLDAVRDWGSVTQNAGQTTVNIG